MSISDQAEAAPISYTGRVAIVTGAARGLGRAHALALAERGAKLVVNDMPGQHGEEALAARQVVDEIRRKGGEAIAAHASVTDVAAVEAMVAAAMDVWGRVDILVNNAGILRDRTFAKTSLEDFRLVLDVHLMGAVICTKAVWEIMRNQGYGRVVMTTSSSGLYGNFGQANYSAAKMGLVGLMQTLALEGEKYGIRVNCLAPSAATHMTDGVMPAENLAVLGAETVSPGLLYLVSENAPTRAILCAGAGSFARAHVTLTEGAFVGSFADAPERVASQFDSISSRDREIVPGYGMLQSEIESQRARRILAERN